MDTNDITDPVRRASVNWILAMQKQYGQEMGLKCFDVMRQTFGEDLVGAVMFGILSGKNFHSEITIRWNGDPNRRVIEAIKEIRHITGMGLREAKDVVDKALDSNSTFPLSFEMRKDENTNVLDRALRNIEAAGFDIK